jgi:DNA polymerase-3 subunit delta'
MNALHQMAVSGHVPHALLLHEDDGGGAFPLVLHFLEELYGGSPRVRKLIHPDIHFVFPVAGPDKPVSLQFIGPFRELLLENPYFFENELYAAIGIEGKQSNISVQEARSVLDRLSLSAVEGGWRTVVMYLPEKMNMQAGNALLKMVEEPPVGTLFLLITHAPEKVLTTISSRCLHLRVQPLSPEAEEEVHAREAAGDAVLADLFHDLLNALVEKDLLGALETGEAVAALDSRERQKAFCRVAARDLRTLFLLQQNLPALTHVKADEEDYYRRMAAALKPAFPRLALSCLDRALLLIERNVNQKILFADMVNQLYIRI